MKSRTATKAGARLALVAGTLVEGRRLRTARYVTALAVVITAISILAGAAEDGGSAEPSGQLPPLWERLVELLPATVGFLERMRPLAPDAVPPPRLVSRCQARVAAAAAACARGRDAPAVGCAAMFA